MQSSDLHNSEGYKHDIVEQYFMAGWLLTQTGTGIFNMKINILDNRFWKCYDKIKH